MTNEAAVNEKTYFFKKDPDVNDGQGGIKKGKFKVYDKATNELLVGFEEREFGSPLEGGKFMFHVLKAVEKDAEGAAEDISKKKITDFTDDSVLTEGHEKKPFEAPFTGDLAEIKIIGGCKYVEISIHEQDDTAKRKDILVTDGVSRDFLIQYDTKVIVPEGVQNVLGECVYTQMACVYDAKEGKAWIEEKEVPRFSIQFHRIVPQEEAEEWLKGMKKQYVKV